MTDIPTRRARLGLTGGRLALVAILVLGSAGGAAAYAMRQPAPQASAGSAPSTSGPPSLAASAVPSVVPRSAGSAAPKPSAPTTTTKAPEQQSTHARDSAVNPDSVLVDPASTPQPDLNTPPTCGQWRRIFSDKQQISYAKAALRAAWKSEGAAGIPSERTARSFRSAITAACLGKGKADDNVPDVARVVYAADPDRWGP